VYDVSSQPSFDCLPHWLREVEEYASPKVLRVLVGNKTDREDRDIPAAIGEEFSRANSMYFIETSAKECENVDKLFHEIARDLIQTARSNDGQTNDSQQPTLLDGNKQQTWIDSHCCRT